MNEEQYRQLTRRINRYTAPVNVKRYLVESDLMNFNPGESAEVEVKRVKLEDLPDVLCCETLVTRPPTLLPLVEENNFPNILCYDPLTTRPPTLLPLVEKDNFPELLCYETLPPHINQHLSDHPPSSQRWSVNTVQCISVFVIPVLSGIKLAVNSIKSKKDPVC
ncbi:hypothetical protein JTB14_031669 [Gonioctena quinquepunctata]|nr:hypothetical protein JTB14_031669 [Gonioctena quinquepunctata]